MGMRKMRSGMVGLIATGLVLPGQAMADDRLIGGLIGLGAAAIILNQNAKQQREEEIRRRVVQPRVVSEAEIKARALRVEVQRRLNALGYEVGKPDGVYGRRTRQAIAAFQQSIGYPASGTISEAEIAILYERSAGLATDGSGFGAYTQGGEAGAFPVLGAPGEGGAPAPGAFPALGQPPAGAPGPTMPGLAAAPVPSPQQMPGIGAGAPPEADAGVASLAAELAGTVYKSPEAQPAVVGVRLGDTVEAAVTLLSAEGFGACNVDAAPVTCDRETELLSDRIALWEGEGDANWAIMRTISFNTPVPAEMVLNQFRTSYPDLMGTPARMISSGQYCHAAQLSADDLRATIGAIAGTFTNTEGPVTADVGDFARRCPVVFTVKLEGAEMVTAATIAFIDATGITRLISSQQMKLTNDLKL